MSEQAQDKTMDLVKVVVSEQGVLDVYTHPMFKHIGPNQRKVIAEVLMNVGKHMMQEATEQADAVRQSMDEADG